MWCLSLLMGGAMANPWAPNEPVVQTVEAQPFTWEVPAFGAKSMELVLHVPAGFSVYKDQLRIEVASGDLVLGEPLWPEAKLAVDPSDPEVTRALYDETVRITVPITRGSGEAVLRLTHQGCRKGLCWPSTTSEHTIAVAP